MVAVSDDLEVRELQEQARQLVGLAYRLSLEIDRTVDDLQEFVPRATMQEDEDTRDPGAGPYYGVERRRD